MVGNERGDMTMDSTIETILRNLYAQGYSDVTIGGYINETAHYVRCWRYRRGLAANRGRGGANNPWGRSGKVVIK